MSKNHLTAILMAAGQGLRFSQKSAQNYDQLSQDLQAMSKVYLLLEGKTLIRHCLDAFESSKLVDSIILVVSSGADKTLLKKIISGLKTPITIAVGGKSRSESVSLGLGQVKNTDYILIHDAARPGIIAADVEKLYQAVTDKKNKVTSATMFMPIKDNCAWESDNQLIKKQPIDRKGLGRVQTPQIFLFSALKKALKLNPDLNQGDETEPMLANREKVASVMGCDRLHKITVRQDINFFSNSQYLTGQGFDAHRFADDERPLMLGGIEIKNHKGLQGHSDGDVMLHAVCDALLGAACLGDIGLHFPDTSKDFKGIDSKILLEKVINMLNEKKMKVFSLDCTLLGETPKIRDHREEITAKIADIAKVSSSRVNVKASTTEGMGFCGRGEGLVAMAIAVIVKN